MIAPDCWCIVFALCLPRCADSWLTSPFLLGRPLFLVWLDWVFVSAFLLSVRLAGAPCRYRGFRPSRPLYPGSRRTSRCGTLVVFVLLGLSASAPPDLPPCFFFPRVRLSRPCSALFSFVCASSVVRSCSAPACSLRPPTYPLRSVPAVLSSGRFPALPSNPLDTRAFLLPPGGGPAAFLFLLLLRLPCTSPYRSSGFVPLRILLPCFFVGRAFFMSRLLAARSSSLGPVVLPWGALGRPRPVEVERSWFCALALYMRAASSFSALSRGLLGCVVRSVVSFGLSSLLLRRLVGSLRPFTPDIPDPALLPESRSGLFLQCIVFPYFVAASFLVFRLFPPVLGFG